MPSDAGATLDLFVANAVKVEGRSGPTAYTFEVKRTGDLSVAQSVAWEMSGADVDKPDFV